MNTSKQSPDHRNSTEGAPSDWLFDAFAEPRTMPTRWDLSEMESSVKAPGNNGPAHAAASRETGDAGPVENEDAGEGAQFSYLNPFPAPRTYPSW